MEERLYAQGELNYLLEGNLLDGTNLTLPINNGIPTFNHTPSEADRMCALPCSPLPGLSLRLSTHRLIGALARLPA